MRFLVTAGNTREKIDSVRDWGNVFTGNTGFSIARALAQFGTVDLLTSNRAHLAEIAQAQREAHAIVGAPFVTHAELKGALGALMVHEKYDAIFMTAAVSDYAPVRTFALIRRERDESDPASPGRERWIVEDVQAGKIKSSHAAIAVLGQPTEKLIDLFRDTWDHRGLLVKFKLEVGITPQDLIRIGQISRSASRADYLVANTMDMVSGPRAGAYLLSDHGEEWIPRADLANRLAQLVSLPRKDSGA